MIIIKQIQGLIPPELLAQLHPAQIDTVVSDIADSARNHWIKLAGQDKSHLRYDYISGILPVEMGKGRAIVGLVGELSHLLENGDSALDLRTTLLGDNVPVATLGEHGKHQSEAGGFYRAIPFRHTTPGSSAAPRGATSGIEMGKAYTDHAAVTDAKKLGKQVYAAARRLTASTSTPGGKTGYGGRLQAGMAPKLEVHHKTDIYAGMIREAKTYVKATQSQYMTFRTISTRVTDGWIRGPIVARHYAEQVGEFVGKLAPKAIAALLEGA